MPAHVIGYGTKPAGTHRGRGAYYLATTEDLIRFYCFKEPKEDGSTTWELISQLDQAKLLGAADKETAKTFAKRLGLSTWRYVKVG